MLWNAACDIRADTSVIEKTATTHGNALSDRKGQPHIVEPRKVKQPGQRNQKDDLPQHRDENTAFPFVDPLEVNRKHHRKAGGKKADGYDPQSRRSNVQNWRAAGKNRNQFFWESHKDERPQCHHAAGDQNRVPERIVHPFVVMRPVIEADHGDNDLLQSHEGDKEKGLQLIIDPQDGDGILCKLL